MEVVVVDGSEQLGRIVADAFAQTMEWSESPVLGLATGSSPAPVYAELIERSKSGQLSFAGTTAFLLDEYVGLPVGHRASYRQVIRDEFTSHIDIDDAEVHGPEADADDLQAAADRYESLIAEAGGIDLQLLGVGADGHVGFNEPGSSLASRTRVKTLTEQTRSDNARFFGDDLSAVPRHCLTQGIGTINEARHVVLVATGRHKSEAVKQLVEGPISARWPATALQWHPHVTVVLDGDAASELELLDYYAHVLEHKPDWQGW